MDPVQALRKIAFELERAGEPTYRVRAFRRAAQVVEGMQPGELERRIAAGTLETLPGIGASTAKVIVQAARGTQPDYLARLLAAAPPAERSGLRALLRGDCHTHSDWSDGGSPPREMAEAARDLGHEWIALTDHSPRLTVANGLSAERLRAQLELISELNTELAPFRILTGIEVDILDDGALDQRADLLRELDMVVASVHSKLRMPSAPMTQRMLTAIRNPAVDVLGHCTGRMRGGRGTRPESAFDAEAVFTACREHDVIVEINCRPERMDPPDHLLELAVEIGCQFAIDSDAHAPGQLDWLTNGTVRADQYGIAPERVINTAGADELAVRLPGPSGVVFLQECADRLERAGHRVNAAVVIGRDPVRELGLCQPRELDAVGEREHGDLGARQQVTSERLACRDVLQVVGPAAMHPDPLAGHGQAGLGVALGLGDRDERVVLRPLLASGERVGVRALRGGVCRGGRLGRGGASRQRCDRKAGCGNRRLGRCADLHHDQLRQSSSLLAGSTQQDAPVITLVAGISDLLESRLALPWRPATVVQEANRREGEKTSDVIRRALRPLDREAREKRARADMHRLRK